MATRYEVERFLSEFNVKAKMFGVIFRDDRQKNMDTTTALELTMRKKMDILMNLKADDYSDGPLDDTLNRIANMWVFGKTIKGREVYIKISMGRPNDSTICISFHFSEHPINYKLKQQ